MTYNGYTNWETWNLYNWLTTDPSTYKAARRAMAGAQDPGAALRAWLYEDMPDIPASWWLDVMLAALDAVDWQEAAHALQDEG